MNIQECNLRTYENHLRCIAMRNIGIDRLTQIVKWPDGKIPEKVQPAFDALCEFIVFKECVRRPFIEILANSLSENMGKLYSVLSANSINYESSLTYQEAYDFLLTINKKIISFVQFSMLQNVVLLYIMNPWMLSI